MPGGYGTRDTPWGAGGTKAPSGSFSRSAGPASGGGSSVTQGSNKQANRINRQREQQSDAYIMDASNFIDPRQQLAASLKAAGAVTSGALGGQALWSKLPKGMAEEIRRKGGDPTLYENEYFSSFAPGAQAHSPTGIIEITGEEGIPAYIGRDEDGNLIPNPDPSANKYQVVNPYEPSFDQSFYGMDDFDYAFYGGGPRTETAMQDLGTWGADPLSEIESVGFDQLIPQYEKEFTEERIASPIYTKGLTPLGFDYLGLPEFGTRFYEE